MPGQSQITLNGGRTVIDMPAQQALAVHPQQEGIHGGGLRLEQRGIDNLADILAHPRSIERRGDVVGQAGIVVAVDRRVGAGVEPPRSTP